MLLHHRIESSFSFIGIVPFSKMSTLNLERCKWLFHGLLEGFSQIPVTLFFLLLGIFCCSWSPVRYQALLFKTLRHFLAFPIFSSKHQTLLFGLFESFRVFKFETIINVEFGRTRAVVRQCFSNDTQQDFACTMERVLSHAYVMFYYKEFFSKLVT